MILLFDLDDTLYPEKIYIYQGFWAVAQFIRDNYGIDCIKSYLDFVSIFKRGSTKVFDDFVDKNRISINVLLLINVYRNAKRKLMLYSEVLDVLKHIRALDNSLVLITNGDSETQRKKINSLKVEKYFDDIFVLDDFGKEYWKPSTLISNKIYNKYDDLNNCIFVGNGQEDLEFAKQAKMKFIFVNRKNSVRKAEVKKESEIYTIQDLKGVIPIVLRRTK